MYAKKNADQCSLLLPVTTPRLADSDCIIRAKMSPIRITQRSYQKIMQES